MSKRKRHRPTGLRVVKRPESPFYQVVGTVRGVAIRKSTGTRDLNAAEALCLQWERNVLQQSISGEENVRDTATFARAWNLYIDMRPEQNNRQLKLLLLHFKDTLLKDINDEKVLQFVRLHYPKAKAASVNRMVYTPLIALLRIAHKNKLCDAPLLTRPEIQFKMVKHAPPEWMREFLGKCDNPRLKAIVMFMTTTASRVAEACRLKWCDVDFERMEATLTMTKNGLPRVVPLANNVIAAMKAIKPEDLMGGERVFGYSDKASVKNALQRMCKKHGLAYYSSHKLGRHAFAARMLKHGHSIPEVAQAGGWSRESLTMMFRTYGHLDEKRLQNAVRTTAEQLEPENGGLHAQKSHTPVTSA